MGAFGGVSYKLFDCVVYVQEPEQTVEGVSGEAVGNVHGSA